MRAYKCRVSIKNRRPPVWLRCWIPGGISFSALSLILDELTGERHGDDFRFEIFREAWVWEPSEDTPLQSDACHDAYSAAHTPIDTLFGRGRAVYYLGSENTYKIEIEEQTEAYPLSGPMLLKAVSVPDAQERFERLRSCISVQNSPGEPLTRRELLEAARDGVLRLTQVPDEPEPHVTYEPSAYTLFRELGELLHNRFMDKDGRLYRRYEMRELLDAYNEEDFRIVAVNHGLPDPAERDRDPLSEELAEMLLSPETARTYFGLISDNEAARFDAALDAGGHYRIPEGCEEDFDILREMGYVFIDRDGKYADIPLELDALYGQINTEPFREQRRKRQWVMRCLNEIVPTYYGVISLKKFCRLCRRTEGPRIEADEVPALLGQIPDMFSGCVLRGDELCAKDIAEDPESYEYIISQQGDKPYHIMREGEIADLLEYGYPPHEPSYRKLMAYLTDTLHLDRELTKDIAADLCETAAYGHGIFQCYETLCDYVRPNRKQVEALIRLLQDVCNNTPTCLNRGYTPNRLSDSGLRL